RPDAHGSTIPGPTDTVRRTRRGGGLAAYGKISLTRNMPTWGYFPTACPGTPYGGTDRAYLRDRRAVLERRREDHRGPRLDLGLLADAAQQVLEVGGRPCPDLQHVVLVAGDRVAVLHVVELANAVGQVVGLARVKGGHRDKRGDEQAERLLVDLGPVAT